MELRVRDSNGASAIPMFLFILLMGLLLVGCSRGDSERLSPTPYPAHTSFAGASQGQGDVASTALGPSSVPLELWSPLDGTETEIGAIRVFGKTRIDAVVAINGRPVEVAADGTFYRDQELKEGPNLIEVVSTDIYGNVAYGSTVVFSFPPSGNLPLEVFYPYDGLEVREGKIAVIGGTHRGAAVVVNGDLVGLNKLGIFATEVTLLEGSNTVEVINEDVAQRLNFEGIEVHYIP